MRQAWVSGVVDGNGAQPSGSDTREKKPSKHRARCSGVRAYKSREARFDAGDIIAGSRQRSRKPGPRAKRAHLHRKAARRAGERLMLPSTTGH